MVTNSLRVQAVDRLLELVVVLGEDMARGLGQAGLTVPRAHLLWEVGRRGASTQRALADALRVTPRNVTGLVDGLVAGGLVRRDPHPTDRRATLVTLTADGARTADALARGHQELADVLFGALPDEQVRTFATTAETVLARLVARLSEDSGTAAGRSR